MPRDRRQHPDPHALQYLSGGFFDDKVLALYARGLTIAGEFKRSSRRCMRSRCHPACNRLITDAIIAEITWQSRLLEPMYPVVFFDALRVKIRDEATVRSKAVYLALAILPDGSRDILGLGIEQTEGAKFWLKVFTDLKTRGCQDILIAVTDGLKGLEEALAAVWPQTTLQTCIVHLLRQRLDFANWQQRESGYRVARDHRTKCRRGVASARRLRARRMGATVSDGGRRLAPCVDADHSLLCLPA